MSLHQGPYSDKLPLFPGLPGTIHVQASRPRPQSYGSSAQSDLLPLSPLFEDIYIYIYIYIYIIAIIAYTYVSHLYLWLLGMKLDVWNGSEILPIAPILNTRYKSPPIAKKLNAVPF